MNNIQRVIEERLNDFEESCGDYSIATLGDKFVKYRNLLQWGSLKYYHAQTITKVLTAIEEEVGKEKLNEKWCTEECLNINPCTHECIDSAFNKVQSLLKQAKDSIK